MEQELQERLDLATRLLCEMLKRYDPPTAEHRLWKAKHDEDDARRTIAEQKRAEAIEAEQRRRQQHDELVASAASKLTAEELAALTRS